MEEPKFQMDFAGRPLVIEVGKLAKQASGAALVRYCLLYTSPSPRD